MAHRKLAYQVFKTSENWTATALPVHELFNIYFRDSYHPQLVGWAKRIRVEGEREWERKRASDSTLHAALQTVVYMLMPMNALFDPNWKPTLINYLKIMYTNYALNGWRTQDRSTPWKKSINIPSLLLLALPLLHSTRAIFLLYLDLLLFLSSSLFVPVFHLHLCIFTIAPLLLRRARCARVPNI